MESISRPEVQFIEAHDGDSYWFQVNWLADKHRPWFGSEILLLRLRDYGARELLDTAQTDPKNLGRVDGPTAKLMATDTLDRAGSVCAEFHGLNDFANPVVWIWIDGQSLGEILLQQKVVGITKTKGLD